MNDSQQNNTTTTEQQHQPSRSASQQHQLQIQQHQQHHTTWQRNLPSTSGYGDFLITVSPLAQLWNWVSWQSSAMQQQRCERAVLSARAASIILLLGGPPILCLGLLVIDSSRCGCYMFLYPTLLMMLCLQGTSLWLDWATCWTKWWMPLAWHWSALGWGYNPHTFVWSRIWCDLVL